MNRNKTNYTSPDVGHSTTQ